MREVIALSMKDEAGGLDELLIRLSRAGIHIDSAYSRLVGDQKTAVLFIEVPDVIDAQQHLLKNNIEILSDTVVYGK
jgi:hypothetical protein